MADAQATVALNIGSQRISMGVFKTSKNGGLILDKYESTSILADPAADMARLPQIRVAVTELADKLNIGKTKLRYAISGQSVFTRFIKLPPIEDDNIDELVAFEAQQHVPFPIEEVIWDWQQLESGSAEKEVALVAIKGDALNEINDVIVDAGQGTEEIDASPMALYNAMRYNYPNLEETTLLIDIGAKTCNLIYLEGKRMFTRSVAVGGASISTAIAKEYNVSFSEAESQKCSNGIVALNTAHTSQLDEATAALATVIRNALGKLPAEIARTTNYFRSQHGGKAPKQVFIAGGGANLPFIADFFHEKLRLPINFFNPLQRVSIGKGVDVDKVSAEAHQLGELVGLALRAAGKADLNIDLVPDVVSRQRDLIQRKPYLLTASAIFLASLGLWAASNFIKNEKADAKLQSIENDIKTLESYAKPLDKIQKREKELDQYKSQVFASQSARTRWINILEDLGNNFASDTVWLVDFDPVVGFRKDEKSNPKDLHQSIIEPAFFNVGYGSSALTKLKAQTSPKPKGRKHRRAAKTEPVKPMINAIRIKGFWRASAGGYKDVYKLINKLREHSEFFDVPAQKEMKINLSNRLEEDAYAAPFDVLIPLKTAIPAPDRNHFTQ